MWASRVGPITDWVRGVGAGPLRPPHVIGTRGGQTARVMCIHIASVGAVAVVNMYLFCEGAPGAALPQHARGWGKVPVDFFVVAGNGPMGAARNIPRGKQRRCVRVAQCRGRPGPRQTASRGRVLAAAAHPASRPRRREWGAWWGAMGPWRTPWASPHSRPRTRWNPGRSRHWLWHLARPLLPLAVERWAPLLPLPLPTS